MRSEQLLYDVGFGGKKKSARFSRVEQTSSRRESDGAGHETRRRRGRMHAAAVECALIIDKLFSRSLSEPAHIWAGVLCGRYHSVRKGGGGDGSLIFVKASCSGYLRPRNQRSFGSVYVNPLKDPLGLI